MTEANQAAGNVVHNTLWESSGPSSHSQVNILV